MMVRGVYVHIPFCSHRCPYCDFTSVTNSPVDYRDYVDALLREASFYRELEFDLRTLYLGGGTPTLLEPQYLGSIIENIGELFGASLLEEVTVECNPKTYDYKAFRELLSYGVNRLSIGVQSFTSKGLRVLGRDHGVEDSLRTFYEAEEAGFENINIDLIYAFPGQKGDDIDLELKFIEKLKPAHVSAYMLTPYENTSLGISLLKGTLRAPGEEDLKGIYDRLWKGLKELGYERYEISNWAVGGRECRHNLLYWKMENFLGLGVSAWGFVDNLRYGNTRNILEYMREVSKGRKPVEVRVELSERDVFEEELMLKLRLKWGLSREEENLIPNRLKVFFEKKDGRLGIREEFMLLSDEIITEVLLYNSHRNPAEVKNG
jgi:oxygen-independent coproporphyrinogen-3 oxidase